MRQVTRKGLLTVAAAGGFIAFSGGSVLADANAGGAAVGSPGVASGNNVQVPVEVPVQACGNSINVVGALNPAFGNQCVETGSQHGGGSHEGDQGTHPGDPQGGSGEQGPAAGSGGSGGADASGVAAGSPGVASGNNVEVPVEVPVQVCGNTIDVVGVLNPAFGNECVEGDGPHHPEEPGHPGYPGEEEPPASEEPSAPEAPRGEEPPAATPVDAEPPAAGDEESGTRVTGPRPAGDVADDPVGEELAQTGAGVPVGALVPMGAGLLLGGTVLFRRARVARTR
jgi:hypothetical protein